MTLRSIFRHREAERRQQSTVPVARAAVDAEPDGVAPVTAALQALVAETRYELVPLKSVDAAIAALPPASPVSVTCSPAKGVDATLALTAHLIELGHDAVPHLSARLVEGSLHVDRIAGWLRENDVREVFVIAGDHTPPVGPYHEGVALLRELVERDTPLERVGVPAYPDGHPLIDGAVLRTALHDKQTIVEAAGLRGSVTTQMCFDASRIRSWVVEMRAAGMTMPIDLGVPGVVDRTRLMSMGVRLGVGASLRFLRKNRAMLKMVAPGGFDPTALIAELADDAVALGIEGIHAFTFNSVADTAAWQAAILGR